MGVRGPLWGAMVLGWAELPTATVPSPDWVMYGPQKTQVISGSQQQCRQRWQQPQRCAVLCRAECTQSMLSSPA